jgi:hypothetical protein
MIKEFAFAKGDLVLVQNNKIDMELNCKTKLHYLGPMVVIRKTQGGSYILAEMDGTLYKLQYTAKCLIPYNSHSITPGEMLSSLLNRSNEELYMMTHEPDNEASHTDGDGDGFIGDKPADAEHDAEADI